MGQEKIYDLEERSYIFAKNCRLVVSKLNRTISNIEDGKQLIKSSGSIAANYIEANEKLGDKDFKFRLKIARKEAKESILWLKLLRDLNAMERLEIEDLIQEANELRKILLTIITKT
ncbi:MAG: four helix bundle protein [Flavobacteriaceae bacterium CG_4_8_14_3_um_filter_34_10]|nr:four helix bundle protein [Flavobacteriia bacterium]OIP51189.1 MAG: four helix bundle protein [Flavobacteriaceae bacterium CG2_30_34_30]PIQ17068.1 MAG: four helix bundle protein [Flavobacteriaceae bacterium CG18_big_fil_WC_8_21_14_2_50_34_36]PIV48693.1 MAG: four helix bundle protein [Flavobacteriaceae bacterium CG02_land_8_20_14_3_00_34_13]PIX08266.1 MAG: four helix bundle protein [Flavobacteriaceae bacterium CG_4_8_14_3_um_filter_34_10]PIZ08707.1 MAG: four helix bundle protein [Flavobacter